MDNRKKHNLTKELLYKEYIINGLSLNEISQKHKAAPVTVKRYLDKYNIPNGRKNITNLITKDEFYQMYYVDNMSISDIAKKYNTVYTGTLSKQIKAWGFQIRRDCRTNKQLRGSTRINGNDLVCAAYIKRIKNRAQKKDIEFDIDADFVKYLYSKQNGLCQLSGMSIELPKTYNEIKTHKYSATLDRINSNGGYTRDNTQLLHKDINRMKYMHDTDYFLQLCKNVVNFNKEDII